MDLFSVISIPQRSYFNYSIYFSLILSKSFQSLKGLILTQRIRFFRPYVFLISIPQRSYFNKRESFDREKCFHISIPQRSYFNFLLARRQHLRYFEFQSLKGLILTLLEAALTPQSETDFNPSKVLF